MARTDGKIALFSTIWLIANELRGKVDGWDFKAYVLGTIFYRYISENLTRYINELQREAGVDGFDYSKCSDEEVESAKEQLVDEKGFFILPSMLFCNVAKDADTNDRLNETLSKVFIYIESSAIGAESEAKLRGLFSDFIIDNSKLGRSVSERNKMFASVIRAVKDMKLSETLSDNDNDVFGDAYEFLMSMYASQAGKSGGKFFTPQEVSCVLARISAHGNDNIESVYDPACGSGSLLLKFKKVNEQRRKHGNARTIKYYGQEINPTTFNLCRINMFLHDINYNNFDIRYGDTLLHPQHLGMDFDAIVSNPPYSLKWEGKQNPLLINDLRYSPAGVLAPKNAADLAFAMHMLYHLKESGTCSIVEFPGVLYRGGAERQIRKYLLEYNFVDTIIQLPQNLFYGVAIATCIIVLRKGKRPDNNVLFIDASEQFVKKGNKNVLSQENQDAIVDAYKKRENVQYFSKLVPASEVIANDCNLSVSSYVEKEDKREPIDIVAVNDRLEELVQRGNFLRETIDMYIKNTETE